ncbi:hypothetical protein [Synechococcus sp. PCC 7336]|uniref:hypothetical protein n=1 Tax=Synechococcus sp. PCC 7336 TaxID=195250 RepID=UPI00037FCF82|nr:hypothetical protein [Synechococcus sp. PCC 7336]
MPFATAQHPWRTAIGYARVSLHRVASMLDRLTHWFPSKSAPATDPSVATPIPTGIATQLQQSIDRLPVPEPFILAFQDALAEAIERWRAEPNRTNALIVSGSPIDPLDNIIRNSLEASLSLDARSLKILHWHAIPARPSAFVSGLRKDISEQLKTDAKPSKAVPLRFSADGVQLDTQPRAQRTVVLPDLTQCFVRCIEGLEGVLYLRKEILKDPNRFWIVGCNHWAWEYLSYACQLNAYFDCSFSLPFLSGAELQAWLTPTRKLLTQLMPQVTPPDDRLEEAFFDKLACTTMGLSSVAPQLWLTSLQLDESKPAAEEEGQPTAAPKMTFSRPSAPKLPSVAHGDRYLLYSLLLHSGLQLQHLALSLGESEGLIQARVKELSRAGLIIQRQRVLRIHPYYYPALRSDLSGNNFLIGKDG